MHVSTFLLFLAAPSFAFQEAPLELRRLQPAQMEEDLFVLTEALDRHHAGLLRYTTRPELDEVFGEALFEVGEELTALEFQRVVAGVLSRVCCGHTRTRLPGGDRDAVLDRLGILPFEVCLRGERAWVTRSLDESSLLAVGDELLALDGRSIADVRAIAFGRMSGDGFIETGKERELEREFPTSYSLLVRDVDAVPGRFLVRIAREGVERELELDALSRSNYAERRTKHGDDGPLIRLELRAEDSLGVLRVTAFGEPASPEATFPELLEQGFVRLAEENIEHLAIDLRGNGGGTDGYGALLVSYIAHEPFGYFERIEVTPAFDDYGEVVERDGRRLMLSHPGLALQQPAEQNFEGAVYVLTDGFTFSTAADFATVAHHHGLATFVGEETGGGYDGNTSGMTMRELLPNSSIGVSVPRWMYTTANLGHEFLGRGVPVDHAVSASMEDLASGRDAQLELVLELVRAR